MDYVFFQQPFLSSCDVIILRQRGQIEQVLASEPENLKIESANPRYFGDTIGGVGFVMGDILAFLFYADKCIEHWTSYNQQKEKCDIIKRGVKI